MESEAFVLTVYDVAQRIPRGKVTTYGHLAYLAGKPNNARQVGQAMKTLPNSRAAEYSSLNVPWWRVINAQGRVSTVEHREEQKQKLLEELGVEQPYSLAMFGWFPEEIDL